MTHGKNLTICSLIDINYLCLIKLYPKIASDIQNDFAKKHQTVFWNNCEFIERLTIIPSLFPIIVKTFRTID